MNTTEKITNNKISILITGAHWIVVLVSLGSFIGNMVDSGGRKPTWELFAVPLLIFDLPAILIAAFAWSPFYLFLEDTSVFLYGMLLTSLFTVTFQWLFVIKSAYNLFSKDEAKLTSLSLTDE